MRKFLLTLAVAVLAVGLVLPEVFELGIGNCLSTKPTNHMVDNRPINNPIVVIRENYNIGIIRNIR